MKICVAQTKPFVGDIQRNIEHHKVFVERATSHQVDIVIFPELSLTGYEPTLAQTLAIQPNDSRLNRLQTLANSESITIGVGAPIQNQPHPSIGMIVFRPYQPRQTYAKQYLHPDEEPFFTGGQPSSGLIGDKGQVALAICYELSIPKHAADAYSNGAEAYIASVAKVAKGVDNAGKRLAEIASHYAMTVFMANCVGLADGDICAGQTAVWNHNGHLLGQLDRTSEGILIFDTATQELIQALI